jgi:excisionase family DNA binding protein
MGNKSRPTDKTQRLQQALLCLRANEDDGTLPTSARFLFYELEGTSDLSVQKLLTPDDLARILGVPRLQIIRQSRAGRIPAVKLGKCYRYRAARNRHMAP